MVGEVNLNTLLRGLSPVASDEDFVFVSLAEDKVTSTLLEQAKGLFKEREGVTLIIDVSLARQLGLSYEGTFRCITCEVHSSLEAVGMTAAMSNALARAGISANVVAAYFHDHIFIPSKDVDKALSTLSMLSGSTQ